MRDALAGATTAAVRDRGLLWHPYAPLDGPPPYTVLGASGTRLLLESASGERFDVIDGMSSWWSMIHGYRNPALDAALAEQSERFSHVMFGGLTHEPAVELAEELVRVTPESLRHVFFADSGSVSIEVALKLCVQYQAAAGMPGRRRFAALRGGYHGDTTGAMSVCDPVDGMHAHFSSLVAEQIFLSRPPKAAVRSGRLVADGAAVDEWVTAMERTLIRHRNELAAVVVEPILQGAGGMYVYAPQCLAELRRVTDENDMLLVFDEIATGFGRTGKFFAGEWAQVSPDIQCVGKALTGGYLTLAAVLCSSPVADCITGSENRAIMHGPTFMANPLACAVAAASLKLLRGGWNDKVDSVNAALTSALAPAAELESVREVRTIGAVGVVELRESVDVDAVTRSALMHGVWLRPFRNHVYTMPPYICTSAEAADIGSAITAAVAEVHG